MGTLDGSGGESGNSPPKLPVLIAAVTFSSACVACPPMGIASSVLVWLIRIAAMSSLELLLLCGGAKPGSPKAPLLRLATADGPSIATASSPTSADVERLPISSDRLRINYVRLTWKPLRCPRSQPRRRVSELSWLTPAAAAGSGWSIDRPLESASGSRNRCNQRQNR